VENTSDAICEITGERPKLVRPPYGSVNSTVKEAINYPLILWNIDSLDWKSRDENQIVPLVMGDVQDGDIILLHDIHSTTVPAVEKIVTQLDEAGYQMVTVSELLEAKGYFL
jgi:peptidoglycan/xylan/chitin deacetylase (PgdA/CDA1 family)